MHPNALLEHATELLHRVLLLQRPADAVVVDYFREQRAVGSRERHTLADTVYAVLRRRPLLQHLAQSGKGEMERRLAILGWQGNEAFLRAALDERERAWLTDIDGIDRAALPERLRHNLPDWLAAILQPRLGEEFWALIESLDAAAPLDLRVNTLKARRDEVLQALEAAGITAQPTAHASTGLRLDGKPALHRLEVFTRGDIEVQDEGSQLVALLSEARRGAMVTDFCAGGGGKTLALGAMMRNTGRLYAFDTSGHRLAAIKPRLARSGLSNVYPAQIAHERDERIKRLAGKMDRVLVDAPCSGLGTLRRNPDLKWRQTPQTIAALQERQAAILAGAARLVKPGGRLVYATCSMLEAENEAIAGAFGAEHAADFTPLPAAEVLARLQVPAPESLASGDHLRLWPHRHGTDGFFAALWQRR
jgi:16S rRNA (cytosine967-C5)-methyltransferase